MSKRKKDYEVGYGKPPIHSQYKDGQSGNLLGRPPKKKPELPALDLTRTYIQREGRRMITIREGGKAKSVPVIEAVMHALSIKAMQGSILAQRTLLEYQLKEDARVRAEREERFKFWQDYVRDTKALFAKAAVRGDPPPELYPHPSDVILDYRTLECKFVGPMDAEEAKQCAHRRDLADFIYEMMIYCDELESGAPTDERPIIGLFLFTYISVAQTLPARLRKVSEETQRSIEFRLFGSPRRWNAFIEQRSKELGMPFDPKKVRTRFIDLREINLKLVDGEFVEYRWPRRKKTTLA